MSKLSKIRSIRFDLDPKIDKVICIGVLMFLESIAGGLLIIFQGGRSPSFPECMTVFLTASIVLISYLLVFLRTDEEQQKEAIKKKQATE